MASIQSLRSSSDNACMVITPGLRRNEDTDVNSAPQVERSWWWWALKRHLSDWVRACWGWRHREREHPSALQSHLPASESKAITPKSLSISLPPSGRWEETQKTGLYIQVRDTEESSDSLRRLRSYSFLFSKMLTRVLYSQEEYNKHVLKWRELLDSIKRGGTSTLEGSWLNI